MMIDTRELVNMTPFTFDQPKRLNALLKAFRELEYQEAGGEVRRVQLKGQEIENVSLTSGETLTTDLIFSLYGADPNTELLRHLPITLTRRGMIHIDPKHHTNLARFYAAGDVTDHHSEQVASAVYSGAQAAQAANYALYPPRQQLFPSASRG